MSIENQEIADKATTTRLIKIQDFIVKYFVDIEFGDTEKFIIQNISQNIVNFLNDISVEYSAVDCLHFGLSHLEAISHNMKIKMGESVFMPLESMKSLQILIEESYLFINKDVFFNQQKYHPSLSVKFTPAILKVEQERRKELALYTKQKHLYTDHIENNPFKDFLGAIWQYAAQNRRSSKRIFISYAWPIGNVHQEKWTKDFIKNLTKVLCFAGFQVYLDDIHSGPGMYLRQFMRKIHTMDHVLVINSKTMDIKLGLDASGVRYEAERIKECSKFKTQKDFIFNILLNNAIYSDKEFYEFPYVSFFEAGYMEALKCLIAQLYGFDKELFDNYWEKQVAIHKVDRKLWNLTSLISLFVPRNALTQSFEGLLSTDNAKVICYGEKGTGKTEFIKHYVHKCGKYKAVFWFNASSESVLVQQYSDLAQEEGVDSHTLDPHPTSFFSALKIKEWLENQSKILIILDDVVSYEEIKNLIPAKNCQIIITTSNPAIQKENDGSFAFFQMAGFTPEESHQYMMKVIGSKKLQQAKQVEIEKLIAEFTTNPLKLARACGYIQRNRKSICEFLTLYNVMGESLLLQNLLPTHSAQKLSLTDIAPQDTDKISENLQLLIPTDIKTFLDTIQIRFLDISREYGLHIPEEIQTIMTIILSLPVFKTADHFYCLISHLEAVLPYFKKFFDLTDLLKKGYILLQKYPKPSIDSTIKLRMMNEEELSKPCIAVNQKDDPEEEQRRWQEQTELHNLKVCNAHYANSFQLFLHDIWKYALESSNDRAYSSKKIYIILETVDAIQTKREWVYAYIETLKNHLTYAGFSVFPENLLDSPHTISSDIDHVLMISHKNKTDDLELNEQIKQHPNFKDSRKRFVIPILLNNINYLSQKYKEIAELSFYKMSYLNALNSLIRTLYDFGHAKFNIYWKQRLIYRKISNNTWNTPPGTPHFVGRDTLLKEIKFRLCDKKQENKPLVITACAGMGGVGKTQLALRFIYLYGHEYEHVYWIDASSKNSIIIAYIKLGEGKKLFELKGKISSEEKVSIVKNWLENIAPQKWLIIYDNADNADNKNDADNPDKFKLKEYIPVKGGKILVTSRHTEWQNCIAVDVFSESEAFEYIKAILGEQIIKEDKENVMSLIKFMGYLPLALAHACAYIKSTHIAIENYLKLAMDLLSDQLETPQEKYDPVTLTWDITLEQIRREWPEAERLLYCCSYFHYQNISKYLLNTLFKEEHQLLQENKVSNAIRVSREYSMIQEDEEKSVISLHPLVRDIIRAKLAHAERINIVRKIMKRLNQDFDFDVYHDVTPRPISSENQLKFNNLYAHVSSVLQLIKKEEIDIKAICSEDYCLLLLKMAIYAREFKYDRKLYRELLIVAKAYNIPKELKMVILLQSSILNREISEFKIAEELLSDAEKILPELNMNVSIHYARLYDLFYYCQATHHHIRGNKKIALSHYQKIRAVTQNDINPFIENDGFFRALFNNLAILYADLGFDLKAQNIFEQLKMYEQKEVDSELAYSTTLKNLAMTMLCIGENTKLAFSYLEEVEKIQCKYVPDKPPIDHLYQIMAYACAINGKNNDAIKYIKKADEIREGVNKRSGIDNLFLCFITLMIIGEKRPEEFSEFIKEREPDFEKLISENPWQKFLFNLHMGEFLLMRNCPEKAYIYFDCALKFLGGNSLDSFPIVIRPIVGMILSTKENVEYLQELEQLLKQYNKEFTVMYNFLGMTLAKKYLSPLYAIFKSTNIHIAQNEWIDIFKTKNIAIKIFGFFGPADLKKFACISKSCNELQKQINSSGSFNI